MPRKIPRDPAPDATAALLHEGYRFIADRCRSRGSDVFRTRLLLRSTICMSGPAAVRLFYDPDRFARAGAAPRRVRLTLFGQGAVQGLDAAEHRRRKHLMLSLMGGEGPGDSRVAELVAEAEREWQAAVARWSGQDRVVLLDEVEALLCRGVCRWAGVPLAPGQLAPVTRDLAALVDAPAAVGPRYLAGRRARQRAELWGAGLIRAARRSADAADPQSVLGRIAWHRDTDGELLDARVAAVELLNVLRPTVAVARYIVFTAHALHHYPASAGVLAGGSDADHERFVQEVRRHYPFFPFAAARVRKDFDWYGYPFRRDERVLLDLYGTNHDARAWSAPYEFRPGRFADWSGSAYDFVPQGGADHAHGHRCPGEWITIALMKMGLRQLTASMRYRVPPQDLRIDLARIPAQPHSRFVIDRVQAQ